MKDNKEAAQTETHPDRKCVYPEGYPEGLWYYREPLEPSMTPSRGILYDIGRKKREADGA